MMLEKIKVLIIGLIEKNILYSLVAVYALSVTTCALLILFLPDINSGSNFDNNTEELVVNDTEKKEDGSIFVEVSGAVEKPGVFELETGSRLVDLVKIAGGFSNEASEEWITRYMNLSIQLKDSQKIYIPFKWDDLGQNTDAGTEGLLALVKPYVVQVGTSTAGTAQNSQDQGTPSSANTTNSTGSSLVNINTASQEDIDGLPGIGPVYAARFIENRPYEDLADLKERSGVSENVIEKIKNSIAF